MLLLPLGGKSCVVKVLYNTCGHFTQSLLQACIKKLKYSFNNSKNFLLIDKNFP